MDAAFADAEDELGGFEGSAVECVGGAEEGEHFRMEGRWWASRRSFSRRAREAVAMVEGEEGEGAAVEVGKAEGGVAEEHSPPFGGVLGLGDGAADVVHQGCGAEKVCARPSSLCMGAVRSKRVEAMRATRCSCSMSSRWRVTQLRSALGHVGGRQHSVCPKLSKRREKR